MKFKDFIKRNYIYILALLLSLVIRQTKLIAINVVQGESMVPTLHDGQVLIGSSIKTIERGDIVVAKANSTLVIKRVIGLPGEHVEYRNGKMFIDGKEHNEPYIEGTRNISSKEQVWDFIVGDDEYLILGDNRDNSYDGRRYGPLKKTDILEKIYIQF